MAYPAWPAVPSSPLLDSWAKPDLYLDPRVTDMEGGNKRMLTRPGDDIQRITFTILMTQAQFATFETWCLTTISRGTQRFGMPIWNGSAMVTKVVQFAAKPQISTNYPKVNVTLDVFVFPRLTP